MFRRYAIVLLFVVLIGIVGVAFFLDETSSYTGEARPVTQPETLSVELTPFEETVSLAKEPVVKFIEGEESASQLYDWYRGLYDQLDSPAPVKISFTVRGVPEDSVIQEQMVEIAENADFQPAFRYTVDPSDDYLLVYNLKTAQDYHYRVTVTLTNGESASSSGTFSTADTPRLLRVEGIRNVRDIGGYDTTDGKKVKQGLVFRGIEVRGIVNEEFMITEKGESVLVNDLGLRTEMDLRWPTDGGEPLGGTVNQRYYKCAASYSAIFEEDAEEALKALFADLADEMVYPVYLHCTFGNGRTGTIIYLLQAVLGVPEEECRQEWALSTFYNGGSYEAEMDQFMLDIQELEGETLQQKIENYLLSIGVTREQLDSVQRILLSE